MRVSLALRSILLASAGIALSQAAHAATATDTMGVSATIQTSCSIAVGDIELGDVNNTDLATSGIADHTSDVTVTCGAADDSVTVAVDGGENYDGTDGRRMQLGSSGEYIKYTLSATNGGAALDETGAFPSAGAWTLDADTFDATNTIHVSVPAQTGKSKGEYTDVVTFTATYTP